MISILMKQVNFYKNDSNNFAYRRDESFMFNVLTV